MRRNLSQSRTKKGLINLFNIVEFWFLTIRRSCWIYLMILDEDFLNIVCNLEELIDIFLED